MPKSRLLGKAQLQNLEKRNILYTVIAHSILEAALLGGSPKLSEQELWYLERKLYDGYFAFEALTDRDWNQAACGVCGVAPVFESGNGNCTPLHKSQVYTIISLLQGHTNSL